MTTKDWQPILQPMVKKGGVEPCGLTSRPDEEGIKTFMCGSPSVRRAFDFET